MTKLMGQALGMVLSLTTASPLYAEDYDAALAERLGADEYGMKLYVMAFLKRGPNRGQSEEAKRLQRAHLDNIKHLADEGKLVRLLAPLSKRVSFEGSIFLMLPVSKRQ
ncbi:hypothetical protein [Shewanella marisflavi]|uniref:hypothetical protein n=1 Tax=Shewanella marisflavi TaxID=260364 RepID=UPI003AAC3F79